MAKTRTDRVQYRYGICLNDSCPKCKSKEIIQIPARKDFVCPECQKNLRECPPPPPGPNKKLIGGIIGVVVVGVVVAILLMNLGEKTPAAPQDPVEVTTPDLINDEEQTAPEEIVVEAPKEEVAPKVEPKAKPAASPTYGTVKLSYGTYTGDLNNGQPHGRGKITYTRKQQIVPSKDFVANPGDEYEGDFREGKISSMGIWYHDGQQTAIKP